MLEILENLILLYDNNNIIIQSNTIRINNVKIKIDMTQQNNKCRLCDDRDETINHIISECRKKSTRLDTKS